MDFKNFTFYREHGIISRILSYFFDKEDLKIDGEEIKENSNVWGFVNKSNSKYAFIVVENRDYLAKLADQIMNVIDDDATEFFDDKEKDIINEIIQKYELEHVSNLSQEHIKSLTESYVKSIINE